MAMVRWRVCVFARARRSLRACRGASEASVGEISLNDDVGGQAEVG